MTIKILHIWNIGGTALIAKAIDTMFESHSVVIMRKVWDTWGLATYLQLGNSVQTWDVGPTIFVAKALLLARKFDIIHVHALDKIVPWLKWLYPRKPIVLQYHGTDIRGRWNEPPKIKRWKKADVLIVWTNDLLEGAPENVVCLNNPIDTTLFYPRNLPERCGKAFHFSYYADREAQAMAARMNLSLTIHDRTKHPIEHHKMPEILSKYEYYIDIKRQSPDAPILTHLSRTALEALACDLKLVTAEGKVLEEFLEVHRPENVARELWKVYSGLSKRSS